MISFKYEIIYNNNRFDLHNRLMPKMHRNITIDKCMVLEVKVGKTLISILLNWANICNKCCRGKIERC